MPKLLILSSNPRRDLNLDREVSDLTTAVQRLGKFEIGLGLGVCSQELPELLAEQSPQLVHFCGHGAGEQGLVFQDEQGQERLVSTEVLARLFKTFQNEINCVVLNACDSDRQAEAIVNHINYVVGMSQPILDQAAHIFAVGFYKGLAVGKSIEQAYELGCIAVQIWSQDNAQPTPLRQQRKAEYVGAIEQPLQPNLPEHLKPVLRKKDLLPILTENPEIQEVPASALPELPQEFEATVRQEIDRKEYKDQARAAYDNFGQYATENATALTESEFEQRKILVGKVKQFWIEDFLKPSLQGQTAVRLDLKARPDAIANLPQRIEALSVQLDDSYEQLRETQIYQEIGQGRTLLILGDPGSGKTIALLQLAQRLIERCQQDSSLSIPVVFNLSSWAKDQKAIVDWLMDELREKYQVHPALSHPWITQQQLIFLLDGLDEVNPEYRNECVRALNEFIEQHPQTEVAICSRVKDYESLTERLQISSALYLQPFSTEQIYQFLDGVEGALAGLKTLLKNNREIEQFAQNPLILNLMSVAYPGWSAEGLLSELRSPSTRLQRTFDAYIVRKLRGNAFGYSRENVLHWLNCLASRMVQEKQTVFLIEKMQPGWLQSSEERLYRMICLVMGVLIGEPVKGRFILTIGFLIGLGVGGPTEIGRAIGGLVIASVTAFVIHGPIREISPVEQLSWSWQRIKSRFIQAAFAGIKSGLAFWLLGGGMIGAIASLIAGGYFWLLRGLLSGLIFALVFGLIFGLASGLGSTEITQRVVPNQSIRKSLRNCLVIGVLGGLLSGLLSQLGFAVSTLESGQIFGLVSGEVLFGLTGGLIAGLKYGGAACIQHVTLRRILFQKGRIPWNYARFLDFTADRLLMKKVGGGYLFLHRMLLEHFAHHPLIQTAKPDR